jgi:hypothetical protein
MFKAHELVAAARQSTATPKRLYRSGSSGYQVNFTRWAGNFAMGKTLPPIYTSAWACPCGCQNDIRGRSRDLADLFFVGPAARCEAETKGFSSRGKECPSRSQTWTNAWWFVSKISNYAVAAMFQNHDANYHLVSSLPRRRGDWFAKQRISPEGISRIQAAQKARWAKIHAEKAGKK